MPFCVSILVTVHDVLAFVFLCCIPIQFIPFASSILVLFSFFCRSVIIKLASRQRLESDICRTRLLLCDNVTNKAEGRIKFVFIFINLNTNIFLFKLVLIIIICTKICVEIMDW